MVPFFFFIFITPLRHALLLAVVCAATRHAADISLANAIMRCAY
jgi:hypothetical protein